MMSKILTVVVPTYNAEKYLRDNLNSFCIPELMADIDVLVVNDGSTDESLKIAQEFSVQYPDTYRIITKENGGHGSGINCGIKNAFGKYFKVVDADDWVDEKGFIQMLKNLKRQDSDIVYSGFLWVYDMGQKEKNMFRTKAEMKSPFIGVNYNKRYIFDDIADKLYIKMHNLTIKTDILRMNQLFVDENCYYVDTEYISYPIPYVKTIYFMKEFVYFYRIGRMGQSVGIEKMQKNEKNYDQVITSLLNFYIKLGTEISCTDIKKQYIAGIIARVVAGKIKIMLSYPTTRERKLELKLFDENLRSGYPIIYASNINKAVYMLRKSKYLFYYPASVLVRKRYY